MSTAEYPVWLAVMPDQRDAARADAGKHPDGGNAIAWNKEAQLWYARPGADLERLKAWLPDRTIRSSGGGDPQSEFLDALTSAGLVLDGLPVMDGKRHRVPVVDDKKGNRGGVYRGFLDGIKPAGWYINYHTADNDKNITRWKSSGRTGEADPVARVHIRAVMRQSQDDSARAQAALYAQQTAKAKALYGRLPAADPAHDYLTRKGITVADDVRQTRNGALVVPFHDVSGAFRTLQYIPPDGQKFLFADAPKSGHFRVEGGELRNGEPLLYAEGYATARSLHMVTGRPVVMTIDAGNMQAVADVLKVRYPDSPHLFMADVDHAKEKNKGVMSAERAAAATGGAVVLPDFSATEIERGFTDFNDLHLSRGAERLRETLLPDIAQALERLNYKDAPMAIPDDAQPSPDIIPSSSPDVAPATSPSRRPGAAKEKTDEILQLRDQGLKPAQIATQLGIGQTSVYRILRAQQADAVQQVDSASPVTAPSAPVTSEITTSAPAVVAEPAPPAAEAAAEIQPAPAVTAATVTQPEPVSPDVTPVTAAAQPDNVSTPAPQATAAPSSPAGPYDGFTGLYGTGAELRDRLAALTNGQTSPAALLNDIQTLRARVDSAAITNVYTREHVKEMEQVFNRLTQGGMAGAGVMETGAFSRLRGLLGQRDTWDSMHPSSDKLDINTLPDRISAQYTMLARGEVTRQQFDREVRMLYGEFTRADPANFTAGRHEETHQVFERMASLDSPERAAQYASVTTLAKAQLPPATPVDPNSTRLYRIQTALRDEFVSLVRGETQMPALTERLTELRAQLEEAKAQGVYALSHVSNIEGSFDRLTKDGLAGMPSPDASAPRGDYNSRNPISATLDVASVPGRIEAQYQLLTSGDVTRSQFEDNLVVLRNEVSRLSEAGRVSPEALAAATGAFGRLSTLSASVAAAPALAPVSAPEAASAPVVSSDASSLQYPDSSPVAQPVTAPSLKADPANAAPVVEADVSAPQAADGGVSVEPTPLSASVEAPDRAAPLQADASVMEAVSSKISLTAAGAQPEPAPLTREPATGNVTPDEIQDIPKPDVSPASPLSAASDEVNAIHVGAPRVAPSDEDAPTAPKKARIDADKLLIRVTHETQPDGKSVLYKLDGEPAFYDRGNRLVMAEGTSAHEEKVLATLLHASQHYHGRIELTGSDEFKAFAINVIVTNKLDVSMKNAGQQADLDAARRAAGQPVTPVTPADAVRGDPDAPRPDTAPPAAAPPVHTETSVQKDVPVVSSSQAPNTPALSPATPKILPAVHTPAEKAREPVTGKVTACGQAPFRFEPDANESTFITLRTKEGAQTFWGKELAGLLRETNLEPGRMVTLQWMGEQPVTINKPVKDSAGNFTGQYQKIDTNRNQWSLAPVGGSRVQTGGNEMVPLSAFDVNRYTQIQHTLVNRLGLDMPPPPKPADGLYWLKPDGQGSSTSGDALSAPRPEHNQSAGVAVMSSWADDGKPDLYLVQGDGNYLQGVVRQNDEYQHVLVSLPDSKEAPPMVVNLLTPEGAVPVGSGNGINRSNGQPVPREHVVVRLTGDEQPRIAKLDAPADLPAALHARLGYDERYKAESGWVKDQPAAAPQAAPVTPPRPAQ